MKPRLGGWQRLGLVVALLWALAVTAYAIDELQSGPFSRELLTEWVVSKTQAPVATLPGTTLKVVPVEPRLLKGRFVAAIFVPPIALWMLGALVVWAFKWIAAGFRSSDA